MIRKPCRINVRFTELELDELKALWPIAGVHDWTTFTRKAFAAYRRHLLAGREEQPPYTLKPPPPKTPALVDKDQRAAKSKPAAAAKPTRSDRRKKVSA